MHVNNTGYDGSHWSSAIGKAVQPNPPEAAFIVSFGTNPFVPTVPNYNILAVDTSSYVLIYGCLVVDDVGVEYSWILSRQKSLSSSTIAELVGILEGMGVDTNQFKTNDLVNCPWN